jgi:hypothetical protein
MMQPLEDLQRSRATLHITPPCRTQTLSPSIPSFGRFSQRQYRTLLSGMLAQGHGIDALCLFLALTRDRIFDLIVQLDLPTPHDRPLRRSGGAHAWKQSDFPVLLDGWFSNWSAACIADRLGRSRGSIWYQGRRLGLPKRERRSLHWPEQAVPEPAVTPNASLAKQRLPARWPVYGSDKVFELTSKRNGLQVDWLSNLEAYVDVGWRVWSGQRISVIAENYGVSYRTIASAAYWLNAKAPKSHKDLVDHFDRARGEAYAKARGGVLRKSEVDGVVPYWKVGDIFRSRRDKRNAKRQGIDF